MGGGTERAAMESPHEAGVLSAGQIVIEMRLTRGLARQPVFQHWSNRVEMQQSV